jgi:hypothetical protein
MVFAVTSIVIGVAEVDAKVGNIRLTSSDVISK